MPNYLTLSCCLRSNDVEDRLDGELIHALCLVVSRRILRLETWYDVQPLNWITLNQASFSQWGKVAPVTDLKGIDPSPQIATFSHRVRWIQCHLLRNSASLFSTVMRWSEQKLAFIWSCISQLQVIANVSAKKYTKVSFQMLRNAKRSARRALFYSSQGLSWEFG